MNLLYVGDIMGSPGVKTVKQFLPEVIKAKKVDFVVVQAENVTEGKGMSVKDMRLLQKLGIDFFTGGNHTTFIPELFPLLKNPQEPVIGPANMVDCPGLGYKYINIPLGKIMVISLMGEKVGRPINITNPLLKIDEILGSRDEDTVATIVNFHGDYSSEKRIIGYYLDGRVSAVIGDHWHVPTADAMVLPKGTAHVTDVGMCGSLHSSLGVKFSSVIPRWRDGAHNKNILEDSGAVQFNAVLVEANAENGLANSIERIQFMG